jgi:DNA-binding SARP family transcriptional activator
VRPRLLALVQERWRRRLTVVVAGAGFGKTTVLSQARAENRLAPLGRDLWLNCEPEDGAADRLGGALAELLGAPVPREPSPRAWAKALAERVWADAPQHVALALDDLHLLPAPSTGLELVQELLEALPANGHLVVTARTTPALQIARLVSRDDVCSISEAELTLTEDEIEQFARRHGFPAARLAATGGWPALVALAAVADHAVPDYLWEEVLGRVPAAQRRLLALVARVGGADDEVLAAVAGERIAVDALVAGLPLVARAPDGWASLHPLWDSHLRGEVSDADAAAACRRAAAVLRRRGDYTRAVSLLVAAGAWPEALPVMADACGTSSPLVPVPVLEGWAAIVPEGYRQQPEVAFLSGTIAEARQPLQAASALEAAVAGFRAQAHEAAMLAALAHLGQVALLQEQPSIMTAHLPTIFELEHRGLPLPTTLACLARALIADAVGESDVVLAELDRVPVDAIDDRWLAIVEWLRAVQLVDQGDPDQAALVARRAAGRVSWTGPLMTERTARWLAGDVDAVTAESAESVAAVAGPGLAHYVAAAAAAAARAHAFAGSLATAIEFLEQARAATAGEQPSVMVALAIADAACAVAAGDEARAAEVLRAELTARPLQPGRLARPHLVVLPLSYVLVEDARTYWDGVALPPYFDLERDLARAVVALRETGSARPARELDWRGVGRIRAVLPTPWAAELAVGLAAADRPEAVELVAALGPGGRTSLRALAKSAPQPLARAAHRLLAEVPAAPSHRVEVRVLGPLEVRRDGQAAEHELRRERVRALLSFLVVRRTATRESAAAALWPEHDGAAAANNLRVTLSYLLRALKPGRADGEPSFFVRQDRGALRLDESEALWVDAWEAERLLDNAANAEVQGVPSVALDAYRRALALVRGDYLVDVRDQEWAVAEQLRMRARFVAAAVRAGELLVAAGHAADACELAERALALEPWSEPAYRVMVTGHLAAGDRAAAQRALERCRSMLDDLGVDPEPATAAIERAVAIGSAPWGTRTAGATGVA